VQPIGLLLLTASGPARARCAAAVLRAKKRNMERLTLACGGFAINSVEELTPDCLVRADNMMVVLSMEWLPGCLRL
jgi:T-complex protein 1 subunit zeta